MFITDLAQYLITGVLVGGIYGLMSMGFALIVGVLRVVNYAHGEWVMLGMYVTYYLVTTYPVDPLLGGLIAIPPFFIIGWVVHKIFIARVIRQSRSDAQQLDRSMILTLGLSLILTNAATIILSPTPVHTPTQYAITAYEIGPFFVNQAKLYACLAALAIAVAVYLFLSHAHYGKALRAAAEDAEAASYQGINVGAMHGLSFGLGIALAASAGALIALYHPIEPTVGQSFMVMVFIAAIAGGLGSIPGALMGGLIVGVVQSVTSLWLPLELQDIGVFAVLLLILYGRPAGLLGQTARAI